MILKSLLFLAVAYAIMPYNQPELSPELQDWRSLGKYFPYAPSGNTDEAKHGVFYIQHGRSDAACILFIHGYPSSSYDWHEILPEYIKQNYQVVAMDMLGFGFSDKPSGYEYTLVEQADIHVKLLDDLRIRRVHVVAHDYGVSVAQELVARFGVMPVPKHPKTGEPQLTLESVTFLNGGMFPETHRALTIQNIVKTPVVGRFVSLFMNEYLLRRSLTPLFGTFPSEAEVKNMWAGIAYNNGGQNQGALLQYIEQRKVHRDRWVAALQATTVPLQLINGPSDPVSGRHMAERFIELVPAGRVDFLDESIRHWPNLEDPKNVMRLHHDQLKRLQIDALRKKKDEKEHKTLKQ